MKQFALSLLTVLALELSGCETPSFLTPPTGPNTPYPCHSYTETLCGSVCCAEGFRCKAGGGCVPVSYENPHLPPLGASPDAGR